MRSWAKACGFGFAVWLVLFVVAIVIDAPLMLLGGPMKMSLAQCMADIGVTYLCIPAVTWGIGVARSWPPSGGPEAVR